MSSDAPLPAYKTLFGEIDLGETDGSRSVHSPAAYLADLLQLAEDCAGDVKNGTGFPARLSERRPDLADVPLDGRNSYTEIPYLDIVNRVLGAHLTGNVDADPYAVLAGLRHPFSAPFSVGHERLRQGLRRLDLDPVTLYRRFAAVPDADVVARESLGLTPADVSVVCTVLDDGPDLRACYRLGADETFADLAVVDRFRRATDMSAADFDALLNGGLGVAERDSLGGFFVHQVGVVALDADATRLETAGGGNVPVAWFDRVNRFVRLARRTAMPFADLDSVLRTCCGNRIDATALRILAMVRHLGSVLDLPADVVVSLVAPVEHLGVGDLANTGTGSVPRDLFNRVFNVPFQAVESSVLRSPGHLPPDYATRPELRCVGDLLGPANADYRRRVGAAVGLTGPDLAAVVDRYRERVGMFPRTDTGIVELSLLHRIGRLTAALQVSVGDLFAVLDALDADPSVQRVDPFPDVLDPGARGADHYRTLAGGDVAASLWLVQTLHAATRWLAATGLTAADLTAVVGPTTTADEAGDLTLLEGLGATFGATEAGAELFSSAAFSDRATQVVHDVVADAAVGAGGSGRLLRLDPDLVTATAHTALSELGVVAANDFLGLGLDARLTTRIYTSLMLAGNVAAGGEVVPERVPDTPDALRLSHPFGAHRQVLFDALNGQSAFFPSDLEALLDLDDAQRAELYDNLVHNGHLDDEGAVQHPGFFADPGNVDAFDVDVDLSDVVDDVHALLHERLTRFAADPPSFDPAVFDTLPLGDRERADLVASLRFNGHLDDKGRYVDPTALLDLPVQDLRLGAEFHLHRRRVLDAIRDDVRAARAAAFRITPDDVRDIADTAVARRVADQLADGHLRDGRPAPQTVAALAAGTLPALAGLTDAENATVTDRLAEILDDARPFRVDPAAVEALGFTADERRRLLTQLADAGHLTATGAVPPDRLGYFGYPPNAADFTLPGLVDFSTDIFFLLHPVATATAAAAATIVERLADLVAGQRVVLVDALRDMLGTPYDTTEAICAAVAGGVDNALDLLAAPALDDPAAAATDPGIRRALRRMRTFARFAAVLDLDGDEVTVAFRDQDLAGKFPEPLALPPGVDRIDALLHSADGHVYVFHRAEVWVYSAATHRLVDPQARPLAALSPALASLSTVDSAFVDAAGTEWIVGRSADGQQHTSTRLAGHPRWLRKEHTWGVVANAFDAPARVDAAFVDAGGRAYLFHRDQYVRYSGDDRTHVDEGYPRLIADWWETERRTTALPSRFRESLGAAFHGRDDTTYLFAGDSFLALRDGAVAEPVAGTWGRVPNPFGDTHRVDAAYVDGATVCVFSGNQVTRYSAGIETVGLCADDGYPRRIEAEFGDVPAEFEGGVEAAFRDRDGTVHLFKDGRTVALHGGASNLSETAARWGRLHPSLPSGRVDAAFVGLDGRTYLFSGDVYLRYSGADYSIVDVGHPRRTAGDWGGLRQVNAAFVADGSTHLFGDAGLLFDISFGVDATELDAGRLPYAVRQRLLAHGVTVADDAVVVDADPLWHLDADHGVRLALHRTGDRFAVHVDPAGTTAFHVRYSTSNYAVPDPGYPRPMTDNWWNLPDPLVDGFARVDAVLTGRDGRTYLFSGDRYVVHDNKRQWWSEPRTLREHWDSLPFDRVDSAFVGTDGRTYVFSGDRYVRYATSDHTRVDDRYPASVTPFWGNVVNNIARTGRVDAVLVVGDHTYLFSGDQFVRYTHPAGTLPYFAENPGLVDVGYPRALSTLAQEPRLGYLRTAPDAPVQAAFADRGSVYLFSGGRCDVVSETVYRRYDNLAADEVGCAFVTGGALVVEHPDGWYRYSSLEGTVVQPRPVRPRPLRGQPAQWRTGLDAALDGVDGNTYLFQGTVCRNVDLDREYPLAEEWGRQRNTIHLDNAVDAAFVGADGRTYVFRDDQFVVYASGAYLDVEVEAGPLPVAEHWAGLTRVCLAYVRDGVTYLFEPPDDSGTMRYLAYSGADYRWPDEGFPRTADAGFWDVPAEYRPDEFTVPQAVLFTGTSMVLIAGEVCLQYNDAGRWTPPRPVERIWRGLGPLDGLTSAFTGQDGATYFFFDGAFVRHDGRVAAGQEPVRDRWARTRNTFLARAGDDVVDAAVVHRGVTFLFAGDQYVRYSSADYRFVDDGYPKLVVGNLRTEDAFAGLPAGVEDDLAERFAAGGRMVDGAVADDRTVHLFVGRTVHAVSREMAGAFDPARLGRVRNTVADLGRVDAALVVDTRTYLFAGDQYVRYTGADYSRVDDGYPRTIADSLHHELGVAPLPTEFGDGIDAAMRTGDGRIHLFTGDRWLSVQDGTATVAPIRGTWGVVRNEFRERPLDAAFATASGAVYAFAGGQYVRYAADRPSTVEFGYPRRIRDAWGDLPAAFEAGVDGAFRFAGRTYLSRGDGYVRYSTDWFTAVDPGYPQPFRYRWADTADYRLADLYVIARFAGLARPHRDGAGGLATFLLPGRRIVTDPYTHLAGLFGWDADEVKWCRRHAGLFTGTAAGGFDGAGGDRLELEFLLALVDVFTLTRRLGTGPSRLHADVWAPLHAGAGDPHAAADALHALLARHTGAQQWPALRRQLHNELNVATRDALVAAILAADGGTTRDLFERFLFDVEMGTEGTTSKVREAIAAAQLYLHRFLLNLELPGNDEARDKIRTWWRWMRNYRVWEANRKVFLYPENYLRPELRPTRTPAFRSLESDLLQGEITSETVERAFRRYLDEYTEVSRLTIAGGYVYTRDRDPDGPRRLVLFGRTRTDPRRYYYRRAEFVDRQKLSAAWEPWHHVDLQIDADQVHPVHAFGRVFVFWTVAERVMDVDPTVVARTEGDHQVVATPGPAERIRIMYSFENLNREWMPAQTLGTGMTEAGAVSNASLLVQPRMSGDDERMSVVVSCTYTVTVPPADPTAEGDAGKPTVRREAALFELNPELYAVDLLGGGRTPITGLALAVATDLELARARAATIEQVARVFVDPVRPDDVVRFDAPAGSDFWFAVDHKGGGFLCRPVTVDDDHTPPVLLAGNRDRLPEWSIVDAAVELPDGSRFFFDNAGQQFLAVRPRGRLGAAEPTVSRWGRVRTVLAESGQVDAVLVRGDHTFVIAGQRYVRFTGTPFGTVDPGYPKPLADNDDALPRWRTVDVAFSGHDGVEYFVAGGRFVTSEDLDRPRPLAEFWAPQDGFDRIDAAVVTGTATFLISGDRYVRFGHGPAPRRRRRTPSDPFATFDTGYPKPLAGNDDGLPTDFAIAAGVARQGVTYLFDNVARVYHEVAADGTRTTRPLHVTTALSRTGTVDAAWLRDGRLYLTTGREYVRYTLGADGSVPEFVDAGFPRALARTIDAAFGRDDGVYLFSGERYALLPAGSEPTDLPAFQLVAGAWGDLPRAGTSPFDGALDSDAGLFLFDRDRYVKYPKTAAVRRPYELAGLPFEIVRLTTGTAAALNRRLLSGGVAALLDLSTQESDEVALTTDPDATTGIRVRPGMVDAATLPTGSHLDFRSANGLYYWEIFFHAPLMIADALNAAQRFEDARQWYEYVFDPTNARSCWRFLPFLAVDLGSLAATLEHDLGRLADVGLPDARTSAALAPVVAALRVLAPAMLAHRDPRTDDERAALHTVGDHDVNTAVAAALAELADRPGLSPAQHPVVAALRESSLIAADTPRHFAVLGDRDALLDAYREDPFDPHAIADLRPVAHRRAVVMGYVDNLLDWGDSLFRRYTSESVDEARMLYVYAHDLLGERPERLRTQLPPAASSLRELDAAPGDLDLLGFLTGDGALLIDGGEMHAGVADAYFHIPGNAVFDGYWDRVVDRLRKIRASLTILGVSQPLPLFAPPIDPMLLVRATAAGLEPDRALATAEVPVPHYRFAFLHRRAQDLIDRLRQLAGDLLSVLERGSAEELSLLQGRQEREILTLTRAVKDAQVRGAEETVAELTVSRAGAADRVTHHTALIANGMTAKENAQVGLMSTAGGLHITASVLKVGAGFAYAGPQGYFGPFIIGTELGARQLGDVLNEAGDVSASLGEGLSMIGEVMGVQAQHDRMVEDWQLQLSIGENDVVQLDHRIAGATHQVAIARREAEILEREISHRDAVATFLRDKFTNAELYGWMSSALSTMYFDAYGLAHDMARAAERAYHYENGLTAEEATTFIRPVHWASRRGGLLAGDSLGTDLERLGRAQVDNGGRGLEITRQVSLRDVDPIALLRLRDGGGCEFTLTQALFDADFPGHYRRQIRTVTVTFVDGDGQAFPVNATLAQLEHRTVLEADAQAVRYLRDPQGDAPAAVRTDWRPGQRIALSEPDGGRDNNGLFELRYDDDRYLPFEGTGAVSRWRLTRSRRPVPRLYDVVVTVKYSAEDGGEVFANVVRGMTKPRPAARFFDVAADFPQEWADFLDGERRTLTLPLTADLFPDIVGRQLDGAYATYELTGGAGTRLLLGGDRAMALTEATLLPTPGRTAGPAGWTFTVDGPKENLTNVGLVLTYLARVQ